MDSPDSPPLQFPAPVTHQQYLTFRGAPEQQAQLMSAMAAARTEFSPVVRDRIGQYGNQRFPYATLGSLTDATAKPLAKHGVVVCNIFTTCPTDPSKHRLTTWVMGHGASIEVCLDFAPREAREDGKGGGEFIKELGKLQTYLIRYQYRALFTLDSEPDADEAPAERDHNRSEGRPEPRRDAPQPTPRRGRERPMEPQPEAKPAAPMRNPYAAPPADPAPSNEPAKAEAPTPPPTAPVEKGEPAPPEPRVEREPEAPATDEAEVQGRILSLAKDLGLTKMSFTAMCLEVCDLPPPDVKVSPIASRKLLEHMQHRMLDRQQPGTMQ